MKWEHAVLCAIAGFSLAHLVHELNKEAKKPLSKPLVVVKR